MRENERDDSENNQIAPGGQHSLWIDTTPTTDLPSLRGSIRADVAVIGGGIAGITAAALLKEAGKTVAVIEADRVIKGVTGYTTAKVTSLHGLIYHELIDRFGEKDASIYADANQSAIEQIASLVKQKDIPCDFVRTPMYVYTESKKNLSAIQKEVRAAQKLGLPASYTEAIPLPFDIAGAIRLEGQAQFHPREYLLALAKEIPDGDSHIFEKTRALGIEEDGPCIVVTDRGEVEAKNVIIATHFPFHDTGLFFARLHPYHSYALGVRIRGEVPEGMYYTKDGKRFAIRNQPTEDGPMLIISGRRHKVGQGGDTLAEYKSLERHTRERFDVKSIDYYWSTEDYHTPDNVPYIGRSPTSKRVYLATGFGGWGMTSGTVSGMILPDLILGRENPWSPFFDPSRLHLLASSKRLIAENTGVVKEFTKGLLLRPQPQDPADLQRGEGRKMVVKHREVAAHKDEEGNVYILSPVCNHMGCVVNWNNAERTWDCPCHGSRYNYDGTVFHGPAQADLREMEFDEEG
ncbi:MAG: FAD-dependent oxidoreductase [Actinobacteria bacterium]|nr:FAD-dependent oxidoreductase [Actinomycetota bacterium]